MKQFTEKDIELAKKGIIYQCSAYIKIEEIAGVEDVSRGGSFILKSGYTIIGFQYAGHELFEIWQKALGIFNNK